MSDDRSTDLLQRRELLSRSLSRRSLHGTHADLPSDHGTLCYVHKYSSIGRMATVQEMYSQVFDSRDTFDWHYSWTKWRRVAMEVQPHLFVL